MKWFGIAALVGLCYFWLLERDAQGASGPSKARTLPRKLTASWYGYECANDTMANGKPFDPTKFTCASWDYPLGTMLRVSANGRTVATVVTDRGPHKRLLKTRQIDLSRATFLALAPLKVGLLRVTVEIL